MLFSSISSNKRVHGHKGRMRHAENTEAKVDYVSEKTQDIQSLADKAIKDPKALNDLIDHLAGPARLTRQISATSLAMIAREHPEMLLPHIAAIIDALNRPEAHTRWECLDMLTLLVDQDSRACDKAVAGAETAMFDEDSGPVRLAAVRFICKLGATTENRSEKLWPLIDEAIQCYHGDLEFQDMLSAVVEFSTGKLAPTVKQELISRMSFDAENGKGALKRRAAQIIQNAS